MAMTFGALPIVLAFVASTFPVQSATTLMVRHQERLGDVKDEVQGHGLRDGDRTSYYATRDRDTHLMFLQGAKPEEDDNESDEESEEDDKDITTGKNKVADDKEDDEAKEGKQARSKDSDKKIQRGQER
jgi:hypothetical protein